MPDYEVNKVKMHVATCLAVGFVVTFFIASVTTYNLLTSRWEFDRDKAMASAGLVQRVARVGGGFDNVVWVKDGTPPSDLAIRVP